MTQYTLASLKDEYLELWFDMQVVKRAEASAQARKVIINKDRYRAVEATTGVPWFVIGALHMRESNGDFTRWLHNGDPMRRGGAPARTVHVPKNRPPDPDVSWEEGAYDALVTVENFDEITAWGPEHVAYAMEKFNGFGYRHPKRNIPSPYLWGGTSVQKRGKFVADGKYDPTVMDSQIGGMAVLKQVMSLDPSARFTPAPPAAAPTLPAPLPTPASPKAEDTAGAVKPLRKSKTMWGALWQTLVSMAMSIVAFVQGLPPWLIALIVVAVLIGLYLVVKGRIDVQQVIDHLSADDTEG